MKFPVLCWPVLWVTASLAVAQKPTVRPGVPDDAAALEDAIRAVDRARDKTTPPPAGKDGSEAADTPAKPAPAAKPEAAPAGDGTAPKPAPKAPAAPGASPKASPKAKSGAATTQTQITGQEDAELDNARNLIIFRKNVVVDRPDLKIWCDRLEIALNRSQAKGAPAPAKPKPEEDSDALGAESIKTATAVAAEGGLVVIWRKTETGDVVAVGRRAVYTAADGTFTINGLPEVLRDMTLHFYSPGEADKLVLYKNGSARGSKKQDLNLSAVRAKEIRQRMFSHVPGRRPAEASAAGEESPAPAAGAPTAPPPAATPAPSAKPAVPN
jgi:lipopolysaccharide export system protein LptA